MGGPKTHQVVKEARQQEATEIPCDFVICREEIWDSCYD